MRKHLRLTETLVVLLSFLPIFSTQACQFEDSKFIPLSANMLTYQQAGDCEWGCKPSYTGRGCELMCQSVPLSCEIGHRFIPCYPPRISSCVPCRQEKNEAKNAGYSFGVYNDHSRKYDLLNGLGSFESAKLYPSKGKGSSVMLLRDAVRDAAASRDNPMRWNDVMFRPTDMSRWYGAGTIQLQYSANAWENGASNSDVFMRLVPLFAQFKICGIEPSVPRSHRGGIVYEFRYRQLVMFKEDIDVSAELTQGLHSSLQVSPNMIYKLPSTSVWTRSTKTFDYNENIGLDQDHCLFLGFTLQKSQDLLIDDLRLFSNLFWNSGFSLKRFDDDSASNGALNSPRSWSKTSFGSGIINSVSFDTVSDYLRMPIFSGIEQGVVPRGFEGMSGIVASVFSMDIRGEGFLVVTYETVQNNDISATVTLIVSKSFVVNRFDDTVGGTWTTLTVPVNLNVDNTYHNFKIHHVGAASSLDILHIDNVILYIDSERCPVEGCTNPREEVFVNGRCESCALERPLPSCPKGSRTTGCYVSEMNYRKPICEPCQNVDGEGNFIDGIECSFQCQENHWYNRYHTMGPRCSLCETGEFLVCPVGLYKSDCGGESDAKCVPCTNLDTHDSAQVYAFEDDDMSICSTLCMPGHFRDTLQGSNGGGCFACTESVCGALQNGFSSLRILDGFQYTSRCTDEHDSRCMPCHSKDNAVHFTKNGAMIDEWCEFECAAGHKPCPVCAWDQSKAVYDESITSDVFYLTNDVPELRGTIDVIGQTLIRLKGSVIIHSQTRDTFVKLVFTRNGVEEEVRRWTPLVRPSALAAMLLTNDNEFITNAPDQYFEITFDTRESSLVNTGQYAISYEFSMHDNENIMFTVKHLSIAKVDISDEICCNLDKSVDISDLIHCKSCGTSNLPMFSHWDKPNDCTWTCDKEYDISTNGMECQHCPNPNCTIGKYWATCTECANCIPAPENATYSTPGKIRYDNASCATECLKEFYFHSNLQSCKPCQPSSELRCDQKNGGPFFELGCSEFENTKCVNCRICIPGFNASTMCTTRSDTICTKCDEALVRFPLYGEWFLGDSVTEHCAWRCPFEMVLNSRDNICFVCNNTQCGVGQYPVECTAQNDYQGCKECVTLENSVALSVGSMDSSKSCRWACKTGYHYNSTTNTCNMTVANTPERIKILSTAPLCISSICGWGSFLNPEVASLASTEEPPCNERCITCPKLPVIETNGVVSTAAVYTRKGSCSWVCMTPLLQDGNECIYFR